MLKVVGVKFRNTCKVYYFSPAAGEKYEKGMTVIVETSKGLESATVVLAEKMVTDDEIVAPLKPITRIANAKDLEKIKKNEERKEEAMKVCRELAKKHNLDMKVIDCEFTFDGTKVIFSFSAPTRIDFRELVKELASQFHLRIELRQVGIRDETRLLGGIAPCGRPCCCSCGMIDFKKVTIKMAKTQGLSLNPGKISGLCGRLMCCLEYENEYYSEVNKKVPKVGSEITGPDGKATVVAVNMLTMTVKVKIETKEGGLVFKEYPVADVKFKKSNKPDKDDDSAESDELKKMED